MLATEGVIETADAAARTVSPSSKAAAVALREPMSREQQERVERAYREESGRLRRFIRGFVSGPEDAEDILQDVFSELAGGMGAIRSIDRLSSWLFTVARNRITDRYRKKKPVTFSDRVITDEEGEPRFLDEILPADVTSPVDEVWRNAVNETLESALDAMPGAQRDVFVMHELEGLPFTRIAGITGASVNTLLSRKRYAVLRLREELRELYEERND